MTTFNFTGVNNIKNVLLGLIIILAISTVGYAWWEYSPSRNVYEIDKSISGEPADCASDLRLAVIGDFGEASQREKDVADLVHSWQVDYVLTVGDNNYPDGEARTIDKNIGQYYHHYIYPYQGSYGEGASENRFFPALGNHDWNTGNIDAYLEYFALPGNERYYDVEMGPVHLFVIDSNWEEPHGRGPNSVQAQWLQAEMSAAVAPWKLVTLHHVPFSSGAKHGDDLQMRWPYAEWGATAVLSGHQHSYERIHRDGILYFVNGLGGRWRVDAFAESVPGSAVRYNQDFGAMLITAADQCINFSFFNRSKELIDSVTLFQP